MMNRAHEVGWFGAGLAIIGGLSMTEYLAIGGFVLALLGACANIWSKWHMVRIERERLDREFPVDNATKEAS